MVKTLVLPSDAVVVPAASEELSVELDVDEVVKTLVLPCVAVVVSAASEEFAVEQPESP